MRIGIIETVGDSTIRAVYDARAARVLDAWNSLFILQMPRLSANYVNDMIGLTGLTIWGVRPFGWWPTAWRKILEPGITSL